VKEVHGTARVYLALDDVPGLAMSRSLGDYVAHTAGVSSVPEVLQYDLTALYQDESSTSGSSIPPDYITSLDRGDSFAGGIEDSKTGDTDIQNSVAGDLKR
jgi:hypothetical protein